MDGMSRATSTTGWNTNQMVFPLYDNDSDPVEVLFDPLTGVVIANFMRDVQSPWLDVTSVDV